MVVVYCLFGDDLLDFDPVCGGEFTGGKEAGDRVVKALAKRSCSFTSACWNSMGLVRNLWVFVQNAGWIDLPLVGVVVLPAADHIVVFQCETEWIDAGVAGGAIRIVPVNGKTFPDG